MSEGTKKGKVLVIELELEMRIYLSNLLDTAGFEPVICDADASDLCKFKEICPTVIILDAMFPKAGSIKLYQSIKRDETLRHIPIIMLANIDKDTLYRPLRGVSTHFGHGFPEPDAYLVKPPEAKQLLSLMNRLTA